MPVASWLLPVLWRERDWPAALARVCGDLTRVPVSEPAQRAALEVARAMEYVDPDRRHAIAAYELAGTGADLGRARELACELGWWIARARLSARSAVTDARYALEEAEAWWDGGHPDLCALTLAGVRGPEWTAHADDLRALVYGHELEARAAAAQARAAVSGLDAADDYVMAARLAGAIGRSTEVSRLLEAALVARPNHRLAATMLLAHAVRHRDPELVQRYLRSRLDGLDPTARLDSMRACAFALIESEQHRGFGLRLLRQALTEAYEAKHLHIPGHLAMWTTLAAHAAADGTVRELLPLAIEAIESSPHAVDHVWLGVLATEISLYVAGNPVVAGAYAEIVAEHAPEHPIVLALVANVAATPPSADTSASSSVPTAAVAAAVEVQLDAVEVDLDGIYADAAGAAIDPPAPPAPAPPAPAPPAPAPPAPAPPAPAPPAPDRAAVKPAAKPGNPTPTKIPSVVPPPAVTRVGAPKPIPIAPKLTSPARTASTTPISRAPFTKPLVGARPSIAAPSIKPAALTKPRLKPDSKGGRDPSPVLAALRTPDRPLVPPKPVDPPDAVPRARRIAVPIDVRLQPATGKPIEAHSRDISTSGLFVLTAATLRVGDPLTIVLLLPGSEPFTEDEHTARARVARRAEGGYGLELIDPARVLVDALAALY